MDIEGQNLNTQAEQDLDLKIGQQQYGTLVKSIEQDPFSEEIWNAVVVRAQEEELRPQHEGFYGGLNLEELVTLGTYIRAAHTQEDRYRILAQRSHSGELWYDFVLGRVNDKNIPPLLGAMRSRKDAWESGLDVGSGPGNVLRALAPQCKEVVGLDRLDFFNAISQTHPAFPSNAHLVHGDARSLDTLFDRNTFDLVVSNGLTRYFDADAMERFIHGLGIVVRQGGSYFEPFIMHDAIKELVPKPEQEYLACAKGVLVLLLDRIVSHASHENELSIQKLVQRFQEAGFIINQHPPTPENICIIEFKKSS